MSTKTPNLGLEAFVAGDHYSAAVDKRRFTDIDKHMAFISDVIGSGVIDGWILSQPNIASLNLRVSAGMGIIDKHVTRTFGEYNKTLLNNNEVFVWMRRRSGVIGEKGAFSDIAAYIHDDTSAPALLSNLTSSGISISSIGFSWTVSSNFDFAKYEISRRLVGGDFEIIADVESIGTGSYLDTGLDDNTTYEYRMRVFDFTGNFSSYTSILSVATDPDLTPPADPTSIELVPATNALHFRWRPAAIGDIETYLLETTPVSLENNPQGPTVITSVSGDQLFATINDLTNTQKYQVIIKSVSDTGVESEGIVTYGVPDLFNGPRDVEELVITDIESDGIVSDIIMRVSWEPFEDPYDNSPPAISYEVRLEEFDSQTSDIITSLWVEVPEETFRDFKLFQYERANGQIVGRSISTRAQYFITVRAIDSIGNRSVGKIATHTTRTFEPPRNPTRFAIEQQPDQSLIASWFNSTSIFIDNVLTVEIVSFDDPSDMEIIEDATRIGRSDTYILDSSNIRSNSEYIFTLFTEDEFGNVSDSIVTSFTISDLAGLPRPAAPSQVIGIAGDKQNTITWNKPKSLSIASFRVYRSAQEIRYQASNFTRVETVPGDIFQYIDYEVDNGTSYVYFVTTIDIYGRESRNPVDDGFFDYKLVFLTPQITGVIGVPIDLSVRLDGATTGIDLLWSPTAGQFDGYEIWRSIGNKYSFELVGVVPPSQTVYSDEESLVQADIFYYIVRKFHSEADVFITDADIEVTGGLFLGTVTTLGGEMTIDQSSMRIIKDLEDPVRERAQEIIQAHKHGFFTELDDRRINLADTLTVENWTTDDFQNYFTTGDLTSTTTFEVFLNGEPATGFEILFTLDKSLKRITFEVRLAAGELLVDDDDTFLFEEPPVVSVVFDGLTETQDELPTERLEDVSARQISVGLMEDNQLPDKDHDGRRKDPLIPIQIPCVALDDGFRFAPITEGEIVGAALTWYDMLLAEGQDGDFLLAGTSDGIYISEDFGINWTRVFTTSTPVLKFYYSPAINFYFALTNRGVFGSSGGEQGGLTVWQEIRGMENVKIARGIAETPGGNIFCSSDLGVFKLQQDVGRQFYFWEQTPIFGPRSTESYAILYDPIRSRVMVSNELGIFETKNEGIRWGFNDEMPDQRPMWDLWLEDDTIFAVTDFIIWRLRPADVEFKRIAILRDVDKIRRVRYWKDRLYITTDIGLLSTLPDGDPLNDEEIEFEIAFPQINRNSYIPSALGLNIIDGKLFVGTEERLYSATRHGSISLRSEIVLGVIPTVFVDEVEQKIGYRYTTDTRDLRKFIVFDEKQPIGSNVTVANQYKIYQASEKGWSDANFASGVFMYVDGRPINDYSVAERPAVPLSTVEFPLYNDRNAHKAGADIAKTALDSSLLALLTLSEPDSDDNQLLINFTKENVIAYLNSLEKFLSQIYPETRVVPVRDGNGIIQTDDDGNSITAPFVLPPFRVALLSSNNNYQLEGLTSFGTYLSLYGDDTTIGNFGSELNDIGVGLDSEGSGNDPSSGGGG